MTLLCNDLTIQSRDDSRMNVDIFKFYRMTLLCDLTIQSVEMTVE